MKMHLLYLKNLNCFNSLMNHTLTPVTPTSCMIKVRGETDQLITSKTEQPYLQLNIWGAPAKSLELNKPLGWEVKPL